MSGCAGSECASIYIFVCRSKFLCALFEITAVSRPLLFHH